MFTQRVGVRQGCPLSTFLYIMWSSCMMKDMIGSLPALPQSPLGYPHFHCTYADDMILHGLGEWLQMLFNAFINSASPYNLTINGDKCCLLRLKNDDIVTSSVGEELPTKQDIKYLGSLLQNDGGVGRELQTRIAQCKQVLAQLLLFFRRSRASLVWKFVVTDLLVRSRLCYGLECVALNPSQDRLLDRFQMYVIRRVTSAPSTFVDREWTNHQVWMLIQRALSRSGSRATLQTYSGLLPKGG